ncbi:MAG: cache domain-containing protein [Pseudobdellovibrionaceae bacterium]
MKQAINGDYYTMLLQLEKNYERRENREIVSLVNNAAELISKNGESAFKELSVSGSRWRQGELYIFILDPQGNMLVHPDPELEGKHLFDQKDVNGKLITQGLINAALEFQDKSESWYHYQWPVPGGLLPRWKSSYVQLVKAPSTSSYIVGCGVYNDNMDRPFVVDAVRNAVKQIEKHGAKAFSLFYDPKEPFLAKDGYIFVYDLNGINLVLPPFPHLEKQNLSEMKDAQGKKFVREMLELVKKQGSGWVNYMFPKPGESISTEKSAFVTKTKIGNQWIMVGSGVYLHEALKVEPAIKPLTASELMTLVREAAAILHNLGEKAFPSFRKPGSKWFHDNVYLFIWTMDGTRILHAADPSVEGKKVRWMKDTLERPIGQMFLDAAQSRTGEGWVHYMYPEPEHIFPTWKSTFIKKVTFPSGKQHLVGCGIYNMQMNKIFIEDLVQRAANLISEKGSDSFNELRDRKGPYNFMDTYVFVDTMDGIELVNPAFPSLEGKNLTALTDLQGKSVMKEKISIVTNEGSGWIDYYWYKPGQNTVGRKQTFVRSAEAGTTRYIIGAGFYPTE